MPGDLPSIFLIIVMLLLAVVSKWDDVFLFVCWAILATFACFGIGGILTGVRV